MRPLTFTRPKVLMQVAGEPIIGHALRRLALAGVTEALLITMYLEEKVAEWAGKTPSYGIRIETRSQGLDRYGTGAATMVAKDWVCDEPFVMTFGDILMPDSNYVALRELHAAHPDATVLTGWWSDSVGGGLIMADNGVAASIVERPATRQPGYINAGLFVLQAGVFADIDRLEPSPRGEYELTDVFHAMIARGENPRLLKVDGFWTNVSGSAEILEAGQATMDLWPGTGQLIDEPCKVDRTATLRGRLRIGARSSVDEARIGPYAALGAGCHVLEGATVENCELLPGSTVGEGAHVAYALLGEGVVVADGARAVGTPDHPLAVADGQVYGA